MFIQSNGVGVDVTNAISASKRLSVLGRFVADVEITSTFSDAHAAKQSETL